MSGQGRLGLLHGVVVGITAAIGVGGAWAPAAVGATGPLSFSAPALVDHQAPFSTTPGIDTVSCPTSSFCLAADSRGAVLTTANPTAATPTWSQRQSVDNSFAAVDASCPSTTLCVAVATNGGGDVTATTNPTASTPTWSAPVQIDSSPLDAISCPSTGLCVAVDNNGGVVISTDPGAGSPTWNCRPTRTSLAAPPTTS
jgi:hypothetical protein